METSSDLTKFDSMSFWMLGQTWVHQFTTFTDKLLHELLHHYGESNVPGKLKTWKFKDYLRYLTKGSLYVYL